MTDRDRLSEERDFLLESLRDLERERAAGDIDDGDYQTLRDDYTVRAARIIRELEEGEEPLVRRTSTWRKVVAWSIGEALIASGAGWLVAAQSGQRLPGQTITGGIEDSTASVLSQARALNFEDPALAIDLYGRVLELDPDNVEALTYRAWLVSLIARDTADDVRAMAFTAATDGLKRAIEIDPEYADAHCFLGIVLFRLGDDAAGAKEALAVCEAKNPPAVVKSFVDAIVAEVDAALVD
ncbi:MAG: tetratricopeptide repeat protein [Ilumatobacteraceae bacterium]